MAPPPLNPTIRYYPAGIRKTYWAATIGNYQAPTRAELNAGVDLTAEISAMSGWSITSNMVDTPDMGSRFVGQVPGALVGQKNDITFYQSQNSQDVRSLLSNNMAGFITVLWEGDIVGQLMDVFPVLIASVAPDATVNKAGEIMIDFALTRVPAIGTVIPG